MNEVFNKAPSFIPSSPKSLEFPELVLEVAERFPFALDEIGKYSEEIPEYTPFDVFNPELDLAKKLEERFNHYGSDKSRDHSYHVIYGDVLTQLGIDKELSILEIGIGSNNPELISNMGVDGKPGASLRAFRDVAKNSNIYGADIDKNILFHEERIQTAWVDQMKPGTFRTMSQKFGDIKYDLIIDDGLHVISANLNTLLFGLTKLKEGGWIIIEDIFAGKVCWHSVYRFLPPTDFNRFIVQCPEGCLMFLVQKKKPSGLKSILEEINPSTKKRIKWNPASSNQLTIAEQQSTITALQSIVSEQQATISEQQAISIKFQKTILEQQSVSTELQSTILEQKSIAVSLQSTVSEQESIITALKSTISQQQKPIQKQQPIIKDQQATISKQQVLIKNQKSIVTKQKSRIKELQRSNKQHIKNLESEIKDLKNSLSFRIGWALTAPLRWLYELIKTPNSNQFTLWLKFIPVIFLKPFSFFKHLNKKNIRTLKRALVYEDPKVIYQNFVKLLNGEQQQATINKNNNIPTQIFKDYNVSQRTNESRTILFISHDTKLAGAQLMLIHLMKWLKEHTLINIKIITLDGGTLLEQFKKLGDTIIWSDFIEKHPNTINRKIALNEFCNHVDLIYGNTALSARIYDELNTLNVPIISHVHELQKSIDQYVPQESINKMHSFSDAYIACSTPVENNLIQRHHAKNKKTTKIHEFINRYEKANNKPNKTKLRKELGLNENDYIVVGCGTIYWRKGVDLFIETAIKLKELKGRGFHFYWIGENAWDAGHEGDYPSWKILQNQIKKHGLTEFISFLGVKQNPRDYFLASDIYYLPSREDPFPLAALEAAECYLPIICFEDGGGMPEFVESDAGFIVPFEDTTSVAQKISFLMDHEKEGLTLGHRARKKLLERHTVNIGAPRILEFIEKIGSFKVPIKIKTEHQPKAQIHTKGGNTAIIVTHIADLSGAPQIILKIAELLKKKHHYNLIIFSLKSGVLIKEFNKYGKTWIVDDNIVKRKGITVYEFLSKTSDDISFALVNTACCASIMPDIKKNNIPIASFIHDYTYPWHENYLKVLYNNSDHIIYSTQFMIDKNKHDYPFDINKTAIIPQGLYKEEFLNADLEQLKLEYRNKLSIPENAFVVFGCGSVNPRKGVDVFIQTAIHTIALAPDKEIYFLWLGGEIKNYGKGSYHRFLHRDIVNTGNTKKILFLDAVFDVSPYFALADLFFLSSREDPFPSVVYEAFMAELPVMGIEGSSGAIELLRKCDNFIVTYDKRAEIPQEILKLMNQPEALKHAGQKGKELILRDFKFEDYVDKILDLVAPSKNVIPLKKIPQAKLPYNIEIPITEVQPIFIIGAARSGTSIITRALVNGAGIEGYNEGHFVEMLFHLMKESERFFNNKKHLMKEKRHMVAHIQQEEIENKIIQIFRTKCETIHKSKIWIEKTPNAQMISAIPYLIKAWPHAKFIFAKRRSIENITSRLKKFSEYPFETHCLEWKNCMESWLKVKDMVKNQSIEIEQREIALHPKKVANDIGDFLSLDKNKINSLIKTFTTERPQQTGNIEKSDAINLSETNWSDEDIETFKMHCREINKVFGYSETSSYYL